VVSDFLDLPRNMSILSTCPQIRVLELKEP